MQKHRRDESPPFVSSDKIWPRDAHAEPDLRYTAQSPQNAQPAASSRSCNCHPAHAQHQDVCYQQRGCYRRFVLSENSRKFLAKSRERKAQVRATHVTPRGVDSDERAARRANLRTTLLFASTSAKKPPRKILPALQTLLPHIRKRQFSSLRATHRVPIIQNSRFIP